MCARARVLALLVAALLVPAAAAEAAPSLTELPLGVTDAAPNDLAAGPDGALWVSATQKESIARMTIDGTTTQFRTPTAKSQPKGVTLGPDGNLWFTEFGGGGSIGRITPAGVVSEWPTPTANSQPQEIVTGPDGNLWFTEWGGGGAVGSITPSGTITEYRVGLTTNSKPTGIALGPDGNLWFTEQAANGQIGRITPSGLITEWATPTDRSAPQDITAGADGALWFTEQNGGGAIGRITTTGLMTEYRTGLTTSSQPDGIAAASDGSLYFTETANPGRIGRVTTTGAITEVAVPTSGSHPTGIAAGPDGNVWFTEVTNPGRIGRATVAPSLAATGATGVSDVGATLKATIGANAQATQYRFDYGLTTGYGSQTALRPAGSSAKTQPFSAAVSGLAPNTTYHFRVTAINGTGTTIGPDATFTTLSSPPPPPPVSAPAVDNSTATAVDRTTATLTADVDAGGQPTTYYFEYGTTTGYGVQTTAGSVASGSQTVTAGIGPLTPGATYHFRIVASNGSGTVQGPDTTFRALEPPAPAVANLTTSGVGTTSATLTADVNPNGVDTEYYFDYGTSTAYDSQTAVLPAGSGAAPQTVTAPVTGLAPNTTYHYRIVTSSASGTTASGDGTFTTAPLPPAVTNVAATGLTQTGATVTADVDAGDQATTYTVEYGTTALYGAATAASPVPTGSGPQTVRADLTDLLPATTYMFRVVATNASGTTRGQNTVFRTLDPPAAPDATATDPAAPATPATPASTPPRAAATTPAPKLGRTLAVEARGTVLVRRPGSSTAVPLDDAASVPVGTVFDTTRGVLTLTTALPGGHTQAARLWGGSVRVKQARAGKGMTDLYLAGRAPRCPKNRTATASAARRSRPKLLWVKDHHGRYRTHGRTSVAAVRGTTWLTQETCAGTLTRVKSGTVDVRDLRRHRTVRLRAGGRYLARR